MREFLHTTAPLRLKDELGYGQCLAVDEEARVLVWTGDAEMPVSPASPSSDGSHQHARWPS